MSWALLSRRSSPADADSSSLIRMRGVRKVYDTGKIKVEALRGVDLDVERGDYISVVGPSGSGKSTLMNLVGCLDTPTGGSYHLRGEEVADLDRNRLAEVRNRRIGFVFQSFNLLSAITAFENVEMPLLLGGVPRRERRERVEALLERVGLEDRSTHKPSELSGGQMQRVAIARALAMQPDILLADEPTGNLDTGSGGDIMDLFEDLSGQGWTMVVVTHDKALARRTARTVEIRDGQIKRDERNRPLPARSAAG